MHRIVVNGFRPPVTHVFGNQTVVGNNPHTIERANREDLAICILRRHATRATVSGWETGYRIPRIELWPGIATTLKVSVRSLLPKE